MVRDDDSEEIAGTLGVFGSPPVAASARVLRQSPQRRTRRALAALGACWAAAVPCVFMPLAHFFLVPTLLTTGVVLAVLRAREDTRLLGCTGAARAAAWSRSSRPVGASTANDRWTARIATTT